MRGGGRDPELDPILAQALVAGGDWDGAMEVFGAIQRRAAAQPLSAAIAWRLGALLYLRSDFDGAQAVLAAAYTEGQGTSDDALVAAWLSATLWGRGQGDEADRVADVSLCAKQRPAAIPPRAPPRTSPPLWPQPAGGIASRTSATTASLLSAATSAGDSVHLARIHANLSSSRGRGGRLCRSRSARPIWR